MLLKEWWAWWAALPALRAQEMLDQRRVLVVSDAGWQMDRDQEIQQWRTAAEGASGWVPLEALPAESRRDAGREVRGLFLWLRQRFWGDAWRTQGFEEDRSKQEPDKK